MKASVYVETTVVSYLVARPTQDKLKAARQRITREWWAKQQPQFDCFVSETVIQEISAGEAAMSARRLATVEDLRRLAAPDVALVLARQMVSKGVLPPKAVAYCRPKPWRMPFTSLWRRRRRGLISC